MRAIGHTIITYSSIPIPAKQCRSENKNICDRTRLTGMVILLLVIIV